MKFKKALSVLIASGIIANAGIPYTTVKSLAAFNENGNAGENLPSMTREEYPGNIVKSLAAFNYSDVPNNHWAYSDIASAAEHGIMQGRDDGSFGLGDTVTRCEFAAMLRRLMGWEQSTAAAPAFSDIESGKWYFADVNTLAEHGAADGSTFRPDDLITRREMAVMLVRALGYAGIAADEKNTVFTDVTADGGYIAAAHTLGIINGKTENTFDPEGFALREEGAAMMMRLYNRLHQSITELHGFYAISSWGQRDIASQMDEVSFGWGRLRCSENGDAELCTTADNGNDWCIPDGAQDAIAYVRGGGAKINFAVTMTDSGDAEKILTSAQNRAAAIKQLLAAAADFDGITVDFEGMKGDALRNGLCEFVRELKSQMGDKKLYVAVHPVLKHSAEYYDAYDYRTLGEYADRIILMAHDYAAFTLPESLLGTDFIATPVTPFDEVYTALKYITDENSGVSDKSKIMLALSPASSVAWNTENKRIIDGSSIHPSNETVQKRLAQSDTEICYSETYKNPYAFYTTESGGQVLLWYEDSRSIKAKTDLAKMFGITSVSVWRIGTIANGSAAQHMDIWNTLTGSTGK